MCWVECNNLFNHSSVIRDHLLTHRGEKLHTRSHCNTSFIHKFSTSLFYTSPGGPVLEINYSGYHGRGPKAFLYFWKPRLTRKRKLGRRKHCFVPAKYIVLSPQIPFMVPPILSKVKCFRSVKDRRNILSKVKCLSIAGAVKRQPFGTLPVIRPVSLPPTLHYFYPKHFGKMS